MRKRNKKEEKTLKINHGKVFNSNSEDAGAGNCRRNCRKTAADESCHCAQRTLEPAEQTVNPLSSKQSDPVFAG